jgi:hypothetical protein
MRDDGPDVMIHIELAADEAKAFAQMLKRLTYEDCTRLADRKVTYQRRAEADVMWAAANSIQRQFAAAGYAPR